MVERIAFDYSKLKGRIIEKYCTRKAFSKAMGISQVTLANKLRCDRYFSQAEILKIVRLLEIQENEIGVYFFTPRVQKCEQ